MDPDLHELASFGRAYARPILAELGRPAGRGDLERELLERTEDGAPLDQYLGLGTLKQWIVASAARAGPHPLPPLLEDGAGPGDPEARRALEVGPALAIDA